MGEAKKEAALFFAGWWPSADDPHDGIFVQEHALAVRMVMPVVVVYLSLKKTRFGSFSFSWHETVENGVVVLRGAIRTPVRRFGIYEMLVRLAYRSALRRLSGRFKFKLAHVHVRTAITEQVPGVAREKGWPVVVTEHSSFYHRGIGLRDKRQQETAVVHISKWFAQKNIVAVLPVSRDLGRVLQTRFGVAPHLITVIPNVGAPVFQPMLLPPTPPVRLVLAARWSGPKDPDTFIRALGLLPMSILKQIQVDWVGDGDQVSATMAACKDLIDSGVVKFHGRLAKEDLAKLVGQAHLLVHPTTAENLPCIIIEALCCGTPVLSNAVNGITELIDDSSGILCPARDPVAMAKGLERFVAEPSLFDRAFIAISAQRKYSAKQVGAAIVTVYETLNG
jgi:glycosyltransferase involved in cell wall biosynthesis